MPRADRTSQAVAVAVAAVVVCSLCAGVVSGQCTATTGLTAERYDMDNWAQTPMAAPVLSDSCTPPTLGSSVEVVQLFTPPQIPWNVTKVCVMMGASLASSETLEITMYPEDYGAPAANSRAYTYKGTVSVPQTTGWVSVATSGMVVRSPRVYIGFRIFARCSSVTYNTQTLWKGRRAFWRQDASHAWSQHLGDWTHDNATVVSIRTLGAPSKFVPSDWTCGAGLYNDSVCHCECGAPDPDCFKTALSPNCTAAGAVCSPVAKCVVPGWNTAVCSLSLFGIGDGCQCGCGGSLVDPDCRASSAAGTWYPRAENCAGFKVARCSDAGACVEAWPSCDASLYGDGTCHCGCGASGRVMDSDCLITNASDCGAKSTCLSGACRAFPPKWVCPINLYNQYPDLTHRPTSGYCDCLCGALDPDCMIQNSGSGYANGCDWDYPICSINITCKTSSPAGDGIVDPGSGEECDSGKGCVAKKCGKGYQKTSPISMDCVELCGDSYVNGTEECDSGVFCTSACKCSTGHYAIGRTFCSGCGNGYVESGEECDSGEGCDKSCQCVSGFVSSGNNSNYCVQSKSFCGDSTVDADEDCDGGFFCHWQNCTCYAGHSPYSQRAKSCRGCGNGVAEDSEECDGTEGCDPSTCLCVDGYTRSGSTYGCQLVDVLCGNRKIDDGEQCDGGAFCELDCTCTSGHSAESPAKTFCSGCGNAFIDGTEQCDGGYGCINCTCDSDFTPTNPATVSCTWIVPQTPTANKSIVVVEVTKKDNRVVGAAAGASVGIAVAVCGVLGAVVVMVRTIRKKEEPSRPLDMPGSNVSFVATAPAEGVSPMGGMGGPRTNFSATIASSELAQVTPYVHSRTVDGTPIIVVPCSSSDSSSGAGIPTIPNYPGMEIVHGGIFSAGPVDPLLSMSLNAQLPQIAAAVQNVPIETEGGTTVVPSSASRASSQSAQITSAKQRPALAKRTTKVAGVPAKPAAAAPGPRTLGQGPRAVAAPAKSTSNKVAPAPQGRAQKVCTPRAPPTRVAKVGAKGNAAALRVPQAPKATRFIRTAAATSRSTQSQGAEAPPQALLIKPTSEPDPQQPPTEWMQRIAELRRRSAAAAQRPAGSHPPKGLPKPVASALQAPITTPREFARWAISVACGAGAARPVGPAADSERLIHGEVAAPPSCAPEAGHPAPVPAPSVVARPVQQPSASTAKPDADAGRGEQQGGPKPSGVSQPRSGASATTASTTGEAVAKKLAQPATNDQQQQPPRKPRFAHLRPKKVDTGPRSILKWKKRCLPLHVRFSCWVTVVEFETEGNDGVPKAAAAGVPEPVACTDTAAVSDSCQPAPRLRKVYTPRPSSPPSRRVFTS
eukprot:m51a1_g7563 hypothetical protein (1344) ;mRNA; f:132611-140816